MTYFKDALSAASRSGRPTNGIKERAQNRKKLKFFQRDIEKMAKMVQDGMVNKQKKFLDDDFARWNEMMDELKQLYMECKTLVEGNARTRKASKKDDRPTADDFLRGDGGQPAGGGADDDDVDVDGDGDDDEDGVAQRRNSERLAKLKHDRELRKSRRKSRTAGSAGGESLPSVNVEKARLHRGGGGGGGRVSAKKHTDTESKTRSSSKKGNKGGLSLIHI